MKILVTGSEGSLMQAVIPYLLKQGHEVRGVDNFHRYGKIERDRNYEFVEGDLTDPGVVKEVMEDVEFVIQAAARIYGVGGFHKYAADILSFDILLHRNILQEALNNDVSKVCYISSSMVYERCKKHPSKEEDAFDSLIHSTDYGLSKLVGEKLSMAFYSQHGLKYTIWRPFNIITPFEKAEKEQGISHVFADFIKMIVFDKMNPLPIIGNGDQIRCFTWIDDVARGIAQNSISQKTDNNTFNLGNPEPISMKDLAKLIYNKAQEMEILPKTGKELGFKTVKSYKDDVLIRIPEVKKAKEILGWKPTIKVEEAVERCLSNLRNE